jgi:hypothetical protein
MRFLPCQREFQIKKKKEKKEEETSALFLCIFMQQKFVI